MKSDDAFDRAVRALRDTGEPSELEAVRTRTRVLDTLQRTERRGRRTFWVLLPIAAVLAGGAAFAKDSDAVRRAWNGVVQAVGMGEPQEKAALPAPSSNKQNPRGAETESPELSGPSVETEPRPAQPPIVEAEPFGSAAPLAPPAHENAPSPSIAPAEPRSPARRGRSADVAGTAATHRADRGSAESAAVSATPEVVAPEAPAASAVAPSDGEAAALDLYKNAYRLHFVEQRYAEALAAWDAYLRSAPTGRLVIEARYNRAIALVRLGRRSEAEAALGPFARGEVGGGYRAREARELLEALNGSSR